MRRSRQDRAPRRATLRAVVKEGDRGASGGGRACAWRWAAGAALGGLASVCGRPQGLRGCRLPLARVQCSCPAPGCWLLAAGRRRLPLSGPFPTPASPCFPASYARELPASPHTTLLNARRPPRAAPRPRPPLGLAPRAHARVGETGHRGGRAHAFPPLARLPSEPPTNARRDCVCASVR